MGVANEKLKNQNNKGICQKQFIKKFNNSFKKC